MLSLQPHCACLRALFARFFHERDGGADFQSRESAIQDTLAVKVDLVTIVRFQKSIVIMKPDYLPDRLSFVGFHHSLETAHLILQLPPCAFESVIECEIKDRKSTRLNSSHT